MPDTHLLLRSKPSLNNNPPELGFSMTLKSFHIAIKHVIIHDEGAEFSKSHLGLKGLEKKSH